MCVVDAINRVPGLRDGRHVLYVISDNDLYPGLPTQIYAFAIDAKESAIHYKPQRLPWPMFWQGK
jgi:hypothetical protein